MFSIRGVAAVCLSLFTAANAAANVRSRNLSPPALSHDQTSSFANAKFATAAAPSQTTFEQLLNHSDVSAGTFSQRYWYSTEFWKGPGSPVVVFTPGEIAADGYTGYLTNDTLTGQIAEAIGGAVVMIEHRYWGESSPYANLTTENLRYLTLNNSIEDLTYFARTVALPFDTTGKTNAPTAPWVLVGGSYSGALTAWTEQLAPGTFWSYHATSAPVEAVYDYWQYFAPVQLGMPQNCSKDLSALINYMDSVLTTGSADEQTALKAMFGLESVEHNDDFMAALENAPWAWQSLQQDPDYTSLNFFTFCDAIEGIYPGSSLSNSSLPGPNGINNLQVSLQGYAWYTNTTIIPGYCEVYGYNGTYNLDCLDTYNPDNLQFTDYTVGNGVDRQWVYMTCNEPFDYWQDGAPNGTATIVSRLVTAEYWQRQCSLFFPTVDGYTYGSNAGRSAATENAYTGGWDITNTTRLFYTNGQLDPWRESGVSSDFRPGGPLASTAKTPVHVITGGYHCSDLLAGNGESNVYVQAAVDAAIAQQVQWVSEFSNSTMTYHRRH